MYCECILDGKDAIESTQIEFRFKSPQAIECLTDAEAARIVGEDRESRQRDLYEAIDRGDFPRWRFCVQIMPEKEAERPPFSYGKETK